MEKIINLTGLSRFLEKCKELFLKRTDASSTYATKQELNNKADKTILTGANSIIVLTQQEYDAIATPDPNTLYFIK